MERGITGQLPVHAYVHIIYNQWADNPYPEQTEILHFYHVLTTWYRAEERWAGAAALGCF